MSTELDQRVRLAAFQSLRAQMDVIGEVLPRALLAEGFVLDGVRVPLLGPQGIFKPQVMTEAPLSITTIPGRYNDGMGSGGSLRYAYRGTDPAHPDNRGLRRAMQEQLPLVYFYRLQPGEYVAAFPVLRQLRSIHGVTPAQGQRIRRSSKPAAFSTSASGTPIRAATPISSSQGPPRPVR